METDNLQSKIGSLERILAMYELCLENSIEADKELAKTRDLLLEIRMISQQLIELKRLDRFKR